jgi:hypothetical protein
MVIGPVTSAPSISTWERPVVSSLLTCSSMV